MEQGSESVAGEPRGRAAIYSVELELFEGPLDLLLHLVRRHELDILDIPISFVAEKYLEYLGMMRALDLEIAGDYLVMAATLAWLKSRELLPVQPKVGEEAGADDEEGEDPREALIRRLIEYERFKNAATELDALPMSGRDVFARGADIEIPAMDPGLAPVTLFRLAEAYYRVLTRAKINKSHEVQIEAVTVAQRMQQLTLMLDERQEFEFEGLFLGRTWASEHELRTMLVVTLMSVLELVKLGVARVQQVPDTDAIRIYRLSITEEARQQIEAYDEDLSFGAPVDLGPPQPTEAELDAAEERTLLAEALAGVHGASAELEPEAEEHTLLAEVHGGSAALEEHTLLAAVHGGIAELEPEEHPLLAEVHGASAELGPAAAQAVAANSFGTPVLVDMSEETSPKGHVVDAAAEEPDEELRLLAAELAALDAEEAKAQRASAAAAEFGAEPAIHEEAALDEAATETEAALDDDVPAAEGEAALDDDVPAAETDAALDEELLLLAAELAALDAAEAVAEAVTFARGQVQLVHADETDAANEPQVAEDEDDS